MFYDFFGDFQQPRNGPTTGRCIQECSVAKASAMSVKFFRNLEAINYK